MIIYFYFRNNIFLKKDSWSDSACCTVKKESEKNSFAKTVLASPKNMVYSQINLFPVSLETITKNSGIGLVEVEGLLLELELEGLIKEVSKNYYVRKHI